MDLAGDIYIWDRESGTLLRHIQPELGAGDLTCISWNSASTELNMFAAASHNGSVRIWVERLSDGHSEVGSVYDMDGSGMA